MMRQEDLMDVLYRSIKTGKGFYCNGKLYKTVTLHDDDTVDFNNYDENYFIVDVVVNHTENILVDGVYFKNVNISQGREL